MSHFRRKKVTVPPGVQEKWTSAVVDEGFVPFPKRLLRCLDQVFSDPVNAVRDMQVMMAVVDYQRPNLMHPPSYKFLAFTAGMEEADFIKQAASMQERGLIKIDGIEEAINISIIPACKKIVELTDEKPTEIKPNWSNPSNPF